MAPMTDHQRNQLLDALMYYLGPDMRRRLMAELPDAYNAYHGREIVTVVRTSDGERLS